MRPALTGRGDHDARINGHGEIRKMLIFINIVAEIDSPPRCRRLTMLALWPGDAQKHDGSGRITDTTERPRRFAFPKYWTRKAAEHLARHFSDDQLQAARRRSCAAGGQLATTAASMKIFGR